MSNIKSYTDINQSKKLAEILPKESADMGWYYSCNPQAAGNQMWVGTKSENADVPCWSLAALFEIIANTAARIDEDGYLDATVCKNVHCVSLINCNGELYKADNLVDACYEMIMKLHELKLL